MVVNRAKSHTLTHFSTFVNQSCTHNLFYCYNFAPRLTIMA